MKIRKYQHKGICVVTLASTLLMTSGLHAEEKLPASETFSERTKEFLSDPSRTGSLVGSIIAGAAVANPLAPLLGSVAGFMIGKSSAFTQKNDKDARRKAYANRSLIPEDGAPVTGLAGLTGNPSLAAAEPTIIKKMFGEDAAENHSEQSEPLVIVELPGDAEAENQPEQIDQAVITVVPNDAGMESLPEQTEQAVSLGMEEDIAARINLQKQLAYACSNVELTQPPAPSCYYYSQ